VDDRLAGLESAIGELRTSIHRLEERIARLEGGVTPEPAAAVEAPHQGSGPAARDWREPITILSLLGRLFIVLGGAYLLRAVTDAGAVPPPAGVALGLGYGLVWLVLADRSGARGQVAGGVFHGVGAVMVAFPVVLEAATRFKVLVGPASAVALTMLTGGLLAVAWRQRMQALAWVAVAASIPTSIVILAQSGVVVPHAYFLILLGVATLWMGYSLNWLALRWPVAAVADLVVVGVTMRALAPEPQETAGVALAVQVTLLGAYLASIAIRTLVRGRNVIPFEVAQTAAALVVGLGGALSVTRATGSGGLTLGSASVVLGAACYAVAFAFVERQQFRGRNVYFYTSLAIVLVLVGIVQLLPGAAAGGVLAGLAIGCSAAWARFGRLFLLVHAAAYLVAATIAAGAVGYDLGGIVSGMAAPWPPPSLAMLIVLVAAAFSAWFVSQGPADDGNTRASLPRFVIVLILVLSSGGTLIGVLAPAISRQPDRSIDAGVLATIRTSVLVLSTLLAAWIGRRARFREWGWLVYPLLVGIGVKLVAQDLRHSRPAALFLALVLYGAALILAPRLRRRQV
jgi:hypothetical protein